MQPVPFNLCHEHPSKPVQKEKQEGRTALGCDWPSWAHWALTPVHWSCIAQGFLPSEKHTCISVSASSTHSHWGCSELVNDVCWSYSCLLLYQQKSESSKAHIYATISSELTFSFTVLKTFDQFCRKANWLAILFLVLFYLYMDIVSYLSFSLDTYSQFKSFFFVLQWLAIDLDQVVTMLCYSVHFFGKVLCHFPLSLL